MTFISIKPLNLRILRTSNTGLTLREAARQIGISPTYLSRMENGKEGLPSDYVLSNMATVYGIDEERLFVMAGRIPPELSRAVYLLTRIAAPYFEHPERHKRETMEGPLVHFSPLHPNDCEACQAVEILRQITRSDLLNDCS